jgi:hypothetical protein
MRLQYIKVHTLVCRPGCGWQGEPEETTDDGQGGIACPECERTSLMELPDIEIGVPESDGTREGGVV